MPGEQHIPDESVAGEPARVTVAICTYQRNEPLKKLLTALSRIADRDKDRMILGVVVADDNADQLARELVQSFDNSFQLGATYRYSGARNISKARNLAVETAAGIGDWIAMTDDDCEPSDQWLSELLRVQEMTGAKVITGPLIRRAPEGSPQWIVDQPFLSMSRFDAIDGQEMTQAFTNNSMIAAEIINNDPALRFNPEFGRIGGEDMVFYRQISRAGFKICFAKDALVFENEEEERLTLSYQFRRFFWYGNTSIQTSLEQGDRRGKLVVHSFATIARSLIYPVSRAVRGEKPQMMFSLARILEGFGKLAGVAGIKVKHK